jgi:hypothetical protein
MRKAHHNALPEAAPDVSGFPVRTSHGVSVAVRSTAGGAGVMPAGGARRGRRDNGLVAQEYALVGDVEPSIGDHLLDVLAAGGIAAYLQSTALYADRDHLSAAKEYLDQATGTARIAPRQPGDRDADAEPDDDAAAWASIVAGYELTVDPTAPPWPAAEEVTTSATRPVDRETEPAPPITGLRRASDDDQISLLDGLDTFGADLPDEDDDEGYTPPPAPPLPRISTPAILSLIAIALGLLLFFWPGLLPASQNTVLVVAFGAVLAGFIGLIWRLRPGDEEDDDPDQGARI